LQVAGCRLQVHPFGKFQHSISCQRHPFGKIPNKSQIPILNIQILNDQFILSSLPLSPAPTVSPFIVRRSSFIVHRSSFSSSPLQVAGCMLQVHPFGKFQHSISCQRHPFGKIPNKSQFPILNIQILNDQFILSSLPLSPAPTVSPFAVHRSSIIVLFLHVAGCRLQVPSFKLKCFRSCTGPYKNTKIVCTFNLASKRIGHLFSIYIRKYYIYSQYNELFVYLH
jgi:hypothetical protein